MFARTLFFLAVIFVVEAVNIKDIIANYPELQKCIPTFKMFDASGKLPSGVYSGNLVDLGNFDQCLKIDEKNNKTEIIKGKYCLMKLSLPTDEESAMSLLKLFENNIPVFPEPENKSPKVEKRMLLDGVDPSDNSTGLILGWCVPHTCPVDELSAVLSRTLQEIDPELKITPIMGGMCQTKDDLIIDYNKESIILITFLSATLFLMIISTIYDMYIQHHEKKPAHIIFIALSVKTNGQKLLTVNNNPDQLPCLNGIRFLSMVWIVYGHRFFTTAMQPLANLTDLNDWLKNPVNMYILTPPVAVDTFFVLSGMLVAYSYCLARDKGVKFNIILFYIHRYLRLTPVLAVLVWIHATIIGYFGSGPFWPFASGVLKNFCVDYWWSPLVYAQNYYNTQQMCIGHSWYLAVDMQLYILSPIILIPLWKWPKRTLIAAAVLVLASMASSFAVTYVQDLPIWSRSKDGEKYMDNYYITTHTRYGPWVMGLMLGYYLFKLKKNKTNRISLHPALVTFGWIISLLLLLTSLFSGYDLTIYPNKLYNSFFNALCRHGWALGLCWIIYACTQEYGGPVNTFLSWSLFQILGRFTYTVYLVHFSLQFLLMGASRTNTYFSNFELIAVLLLASSTLGYRDISQLETTTTNDLDNSVYSGNETPAPFPPFPEHMPSTGCFPNIPAGQNVDSPGNNIETATNYPQLPLTDPVPPQFTSFDPPRPFNRPMTPSFGPGSVGYRNYYPFNRPAPFVPPMPFSPYQRMGFLNQQNSPHPIVIVKLLQPIILPVAKPMFPEGGDRNPDVDDVENERFTNGFPRGHGFHRFNNNRRFGGDRYRSMERPLPYRQNTFGPYKIGGGEENIHVTVKLH